MMSIRADGPSPCAQQPAVPRATARRAEPRWAQSNLASRDFLASFLAIQATSRSSLARGPLKARQADVRVDGCRAAPAVTQRADVSKPPSRTQP
jgi:hypothetical protein